MSVIQKTMRTKRFKRGRGPALGRVARYSEVGSQRAAQFRDGRTFLQLARNESRRGVQSNQGLRTLRENHQIVIKGEKSQIGTESNRLFHPSLIASCRYLHSANLAAADNFFV